MTDIYFGIVDVEIYDGYVRYKKLLSVDNFRGKAVYEFHDDIFWTNWLFPGDDNCQWLVLE